MEKRVIIINGRGGVGKDTICSCAAAFYRTRNISSITPILEIARFAGWNGVKDPASRRLLSRLKEAFTEWNDLSYQYCLQQYQAFCQSEEQLLFVHIREAEEIERFRQTVGSICRTLLIHRRSVEADGPLGNRSDDAVMAYHYDYYFHNDGALEGLCENVHQFFEHVFANPAAQDVVHWRYR